MVLIGVGLALAFFASRVAMAQARKGAETIRTSQGLSAPPLLGRSSASKASPDAIVNAQSQSLILTAVPSACEAWQVRNPFPSPTAMGATATSSSSFAYVAGGFSNDIDGSVPDFRRYDPATNTWVLLAPMPVAVHMASAVYSPVNNKIYVFGGITDFNVTTNATRIYDIAGNTWSAGANMPDVRSLMASGYYNGKIYLVAGNTGGFFGDGAQAQVWEFDPIANTFNTSRAPIPHPVAAAGFGIINGHFYVAGGLDAAGRIIDLVYDYDIAANTWTARTSLPAARDFSGSGVANGRLVLFGGGTLPATTNDCQIYDPGSNTWSPGPPLNVGRSLVAGTAVGDTLVAAGGHNGSTTVSTTETSSCVPSAVLSNGGLMIISAGPNGVLDPGETVEVKLGILNSGNPGFCTTGALTGTLQATGGITNPMPTSWNYGMICPGDPVVFRSFVFTVDPALPCGNTVTASLHMVDGAIDYGTFTYTFMTGTTPVIFSENFDGVTPPALPAGWVATNAQGPPPLWVTSNVTPDTPPNDAFVNDPPVVSDKRLDTPGIFVTANAQLSFRNFYNLDGGMVLGFDGGVLEISSPNINGGAFTDVTDAGGHFVTGGYNTTISPNFGSPIANRDAWSGNSGGYIDTVVNLGPNVAGQTITLRFRMASDISVSAPGWWVDTISISSSACAPVAQNALSRKVHGGAGAFDVPLPLAGNVGVECRSGPTHQMIINFANPVAVGTATVISGTGSVGSFSVSGSQVTVNLTGVANAQRITVRLGNVNDGTNMGDVDVSIGVLAGDVNGNATVNASDVSLTKAQVGQAVSGSNFREDVNANGTINAGDIALVKANVGTSLPP